MNYIIPIRRRETTVERFGTKVAYLEILGKGVCVYYSDPNFDFSPLNISRYLVGISDQSRYYIEANSPREALDKFYKEVEGALVGLEEQAISISHREPIEELPSCPFMKYNKNGNTVCVWGDEEEFEEREKDPDPNNVFGCGCIIDFSDYAPPSCPIDNTWEMYQYDWKVEEVGGFKFKRLKENKPDAEDMAYKKIHELATKTPIRFAKDIANDYHKARKQHAKLRKIFAEFKLNWPK